MTGIKCRSCGKFIGYDDLMNDKCDKEYTPESEYTRERMDFWCPSCSRKTKKGEGLE